MPLDGRDSEMQREHIETEQIVERYVRGELSDAEVNQFEQRLLWDIELQQQLELTQRLRDGMRAVTADQPGPVTVQRPNFFSSPRYAAAAMVLLGITSFDGDDEVSW